jgi:predicted nucleic acid-binding protein
MVIADTSVLIPFFTLPLSDLLIAALALEHGCHVYSLDAHFKKISAVPLYLPAST